ncbi:MmgE/PrpD family protein [Pelagerythrobacter marensis]|uniref:MmgE/PrpD family protein n=1 Tax=Pelagerythrobacter marensis TaxID=543877 RepID=A0ABZ2D406_9SPHN
MAVEHEADISDRISSHIADLSFCDLPPATIAASRHVLLDAVGVMLAASGMAREIAPFIDLAQMGGAGPSAILGTGARVSPASAALANGAMAHALDFEDTFDLAPGHPNASLVPALIALAQSHGPISGQDFLTALAAGGDLACRLALALDRPMEEGNWYPPPIIGGFGAAAGAGRLLALPAGGIRDCLSLALCQVTMPGEIKYSRGTVLRAVRESFPAQSAVQSALLAFAGTPGFETPIEGQGGFYALYAMGQFDADRLLNGLGEKFWTEELTFKAWPSCRGTHPFIEAALRLRNAGLAAGDIARVELAIDPVQLMLVKPTARKQSPAVVIDAKFSIPFCTALALVRGQVTLDDFSDSSLVDREVRELAARMTYRVSPEAGWARGAGGAVTVTRNDGSVVREEIAQAYGAPSAPMNENDLYAKFVDCARRAARPSLEPERVADAILRLETCDDVGGIFR